MMRTLLLDCYLGDPGGTPNFLGALEGKDVHSVRVAQEPIPEFLEEYDSVVITGSAASVTDPPPWLNDLEDVVRDSGRVGRPLLGVCFGHQVIASALFGRDAVFTRHRIEVGWQKIEMRSPDPLFDGLESGFRVFVSHYDEVREDLDGVVWTARSPSCPTQGLRVEGAPIWGIQFHAEMPVEEAVGLIETRSVEKPEHYPDPEGLIRNAEATPEIFTRLVSNFFEAS
jgi:GMP synthase (glutamine-hydrolysing)